MRSGATQLGDDIRVEQVHYFSLGSGRQRHRCRSEISISNRGSGARRSSFRVGRARCCSLRHSSIGTRTAVSTPRFVTICGPSAMVLSSSSLNRAFASCTGQLITDLGCLLTSGLTSLHRYPAQDASFIGDAGAPDKSTCLATRSIVPSSSPPEPKHEV